MSDNENVKVIPRHDINMYQGEIKFILTKQMQLDFLQSLFVSNEQAEDIMNYKQRSPEWFNARKGRVTGSVVGSMVGHNFFCKPTQLLYDLLWGTFEGNEATRWGSEHESTAANIYEKNINKKVKYPGLFICRNRPWLGYSPDGIVEDGTLLEIKCPFKKKLYGRIPMYYFDQIQYGQFLMDCSSCDFFVYTPTQCCLQKYEYNKSYCEEFLIPTVERFYMRRFLPLFLLKERNLLEMGQTTIPPDVVVEPLDNWSVQSLRTKKKILQ